MQIISHELLYLFRAIILGFVVAYAIMTFIYYFKPWAEKTFNIKKIDTDVWWWSGVTIAIIAGIASMLLAL